MLHAYLCHDGRLQRIQSASGAGGLQSAIWIDLVRPSESEVHEVQGLTGLHVPTEAEVSEIESSSRLATRHNVLYASLPLISLADGPRTAPVGFVLAQDRLVTIRFHDTHVFDTFADHLPRTEEPQHTSGHIMIGLLEAVVDRQADVLEQVRAELDDISRRIFAMGSRNAGGRKQEDAALRASLGQIGRIGDLLSHVRETQVNLARMLPYLSGATQDWLPDDLPSRLKTMARDIESLSSFDNYVSEKLQFLLDATLGFINIAQNNVMKVLTIASVVGIPPVFIVGVYGMNFKNMPELNWAWGYVYCWALIVLTAALPLAMFRWRKWI